MSTQYCTKVSPECPVTDTTYGYSPNLGGNIFLLIVFGICTLLQLYFGLKARLRAFTFAVTIGCMGETIGYGGRIIMHYNAWSQTGFKIQIVCLILSPSFMAAGIYLALKHLVMHFGEQYSKLKPHLYTWLFIGFDVLSIFTQAAGGGIAAGENVTLVNIGDKVMVAGLCIQLATMFVCALVAADFAWRVHRNQGLGEKTDERERVEINPQFRFFLIAFALAFTTIFIRSVYRIPEMVGGWGNPLMQDEVEFMVLDGAMVAMAAILMTVAHPGNYFPEISTRYMQRMGSRDGVKDEMAAVTPESSISAKGAKHDV